MAEWGSINESHVISPGKQDSVLRNGVVQLSCHLMTRTRNRRKHQRDLH